MTKDQKKIPDQGSSRCSRLKKTIKDKCKVIGETTMYYGNAGSVQVLSPIPGSPSPDSEPRRDHIRPESPRRESLVRTSNKANIRKTMTGKKSSTQKRTKGTMSDYSLPPIKNVPTMTPTKKMADKNLKEFTSTETCKPINMPGFKARGRKITSKNKMSSVIADLPGKEPAEKLMMGTRRIQSMSSKSIALSEERIRLPVPRGARMIPYSVKVLPPQYMIMNRTNLPPIGVRSMAAW
ncbi:uncharacterized protein LOC110455655 [Mizuhopecten yessoensis]|uniref:Uncharacterized protein n=1 Tax=Mizuhopecten yessoensis TaxID=6573 RepID=A0A210QCN0_MIZYE|nr:uncharacterized protein LOC110455655 [Mizuhopecten yessoensis]OWF46484.1 hypothetical protein KP79_PYT05230 [Mizuhopecten yessoensis]